MDDTYQQMEYRAVIRALNGVDAKHAAEVEELRAKIAHQQAIMDQMRDTISELMRELEHARRMQRAAEHRMAAPPMDARDGRAF